MNRKLITVFDIFIIALAIVLSVAFFCVYAMSDNGKTVVITVNEQVVGQLSLRTEKTETIHTEYGYNKIVVSNGSCYVEEADCRDGVCIRRGKISKIGESIVCLPHKLIVEIK